MVRREVIGDFTVVLEARPVGGLGWTWAYYPDQGAGGINPAGLLHSEEEAFAAALSAARRKLGGQDIGG
jgi:hypothetical protein